MSCEICSGKKAAKKMARRPDTECPMIAGRAPTEMGRHIYDVRENGVQGIILVRAPFRQAGTTAVENHDLALRGEFRGDVDPVIGIEVVAAMKDKQRRIARRAIPGPKGSVEQRDIA